MVGKEVSKTSVFKGSVSQVIFNPYWTVPTSIKEKEILPILKKDPSYLKKNDMELLRGGEVVDASEIKWKSYKDHIPYSIRQKPGKKNALGKFKFLFPNNFDIYLHDTPSKGLFSKDKRAFSHGCVRVENPDKLAEYLLKREDPAWSAEKIEDLVDKKEEKRINIRKKMPVYMVYFTSWVDEKGRLNFRKDVYDLDQKLDKEIFSKKEQKAN